MFTWSGGPRSSGVSFFCFVSPRAWKQKKPTPLDGGPPPHVNRPCGKNVEIECCLNTISWRRSVQSLHVFLCTLSWARISILWVKIFIFPSQHPWWWDQNLHISCSTLSVTTSVPVFMFLFCCFSKIVILIKIYIYRCCETLPNTNTFV